MYLSQIVRISPILVYCSSHASCLWCGRRNSWHQREQMMAHHFSHGAIPPLRTVECSTISILNKLIPCELFWDNFCTKQRPHHCEIDSENELLRFHQLNQNLNCYAVFCIWTGYLDVIPFASIPAGPLWSEPSIGLSTELPRLPFTDFSGSTWVSQFKQCRSYLVTSWTTYERWSETMVASPQCARHFWQIHGSIGRQKADCEWGYASWDETKRKNKVGGAESTTGVGEWWSLLTLLLLVDGRSQMHDMGHDLLGQHKAYVCVVDLWWSQGVRSVWLLNRTVGQMRGVMDLARMHHRLV